jgi:hypothetical protein
VILFLFFFIVFRILCVSYCITLSCLSCLSCLFCLLYLVFLVYLVCLHSILPLEALWQAVALAARRPVIVVTLTAVPLDLTDMLKTTNVWGEWDERLKIGVGCRLLL